MAGRDKAMTYKGRSASPGRVSGPLIRLDALSPERDAKQKDVSSPKLSAEDEASRLRHALAEASEALEALMIHSAEGAGADILEFQFALLSDEDLVEPAYAAIAEGQSAEAGWSAALEAQIADFRDSSDETFKARATDLTDLRDRVLALLRGESAEDAEWPEAAVFYGEDLPPSRFLSINWDHAGGIALGAGSIASHVALLARSRGVPMVVDLGAIDLAPESLVTLDADAGTLAIAAPGTPIGGRKVDQVPPEVLAAAATTADGVRIKTFINIHGPEDLKRPEAAHADGIGLVRSEFLFSDGLPDEDAQFDAYHRIVSWAKGKPVTIRTLDAGGDKPLPGVTEPHEANPFLGLRGVRLCLRHPDLFLVQLRALARAAAVGPLKVMFPMVAVPAEYVAASVLMDRAVAEARAAGHQAQRPSLGMMVEVPSAAIAISSFRAEFYSIGSNDLVQFVLACDRANGAVNDLFDPLNPAVLRLIGEVVDHGLATGAEVSLCGEMASDPVCLDALLDTGLRTVSVSLAALGKAKAAIARYRSLRELGEG